MSLFEKGRAKTGGRRKGARDRIGTAFLEELAKDFEEHGAGIIKIARIERPTEYLKIVASTTSEGVRDYGFPTRGNFRQ